MHHTMCNAYILCNAHLDRTCQKFVQRIDTIQVLMSLIRHTQRNGTIRNRMEPYGTVRNPFSATSRYVDEERSSQTEASRVQTKRRKEKEKERRKRSQFSNGPSGESGVGHTFTDLHYPRFVLLPSLSYPPPPPLPLPTG